MKTVLEIMEDLEADERFPEETRWEDLKQIIGDMVVTTKPPEGYIYTIIKKD